MPFSTRPLDQRGFWRLLALRSRPLGYLAAVVLTALALAVRFLIAPQDSGVQYITFFPLVAIVAVIGGLGPRLLSAVASMVLASYFFWPPYDMLVFTYDPQMVFSNAVFLVDAVLVGTVIEGLRRLYRTAQDTEQRLQLAGIVFEHSAEGVMITDADQRIEFVNPAFTEITGFSAAEAIGQTPALLRSDRQAPEFYRAMRNSLAREGTWHGELWNRRKDGSAFLEWLTIKQIRDDAGRVIRQVGVFHDITALRQRDDHLRHLAFHDALTGLPNRALVRDRLIHALERAQRDRTRLAVLFLDLDRFKAVNDTLGHAIGDMLLMEVASRIKQRLRSMDTVARQGGDEFVLLMEEIQSPEDCARLAQQLIDEISTPMVLREHSVQVGASVGVAFYPEDGEQADELMKRADLAMYAAKHAGRNTYRFFQQHMLDEASQRRTLELELRAAIRNGELALHYQPRINLQTGAIRAIEALVRWHHPRRGLLMPCDFIPQAEASDLILALGDWVLATACREYQPWREQLPGCRLVVNVSARQLEHGELAQRLADVARTHGLRPDEIEFDMTENMVMGKSTAVARQLEALHRLGVRIVVDDFGTGLSSFGCLRSLPIDMVKIDHSFVRHVDREGDEKQVVQAILALGQHLELGVIAEGIETAGQAQALKQFGCENGQGFYFAHPLPAPEFEAWLHAHAEATAAQGAGVECPLTNKAP